MELRPGAVTGNLRLVRPLGRGASGSVWLAHHVTLDKEVAVKFTAAGADAEALIRFVREASMAAAIDSRFVVRTFDRGLTEDDQPYMVMELLEGETLDARLKRGGALPLDDVAVIVAQISRAIEQAHELRIVHRDIKPANIFLTEDDDGLICKVLDFGIAKRLKMPRMDGLTAKGVVIGTPAFMSPEQCMSAKDVTAHADLWALAVVAYTALTGHKPFDAPSVSKLWAKILAGEFQPPSQHDLGLPPDLDAWFDRALHREPERRFPTARAMALAFVRLAPGGADIERALLSGPVPRPRQPTPPAIDVEPARGSDAATLEPSLVSGRGGPRASWRSPAVLGATLLALAIAIVVWALRTPVTPTAAVGSRPVVPLAASAEAGAASTERRDGPTPATAARTASAASASATASASPPIRATSGTARKAGK